MKRYKVVHYYYPADGVKIEDLLNSGWQIERSDIIHGNGTVFILSKEM